MNRLMLTLLGLVLTLPAEAQEALPFKCPAPGATMTTTANNTLTFTRQEGMICHFKRANNTEGAWMAGVVSPTSNLGTRYKDDIEKFWPARVGAKSEFIRFLDVPSGIERRLKAAFKPFMLPWMGHGGAWRWKRGTCLRSGLA